jgi:hypothetical protein
MFSSVKELRAQIKLGDPALGKYRGNSSIRPQRIIFRSSPIHHLPMVLTYTAVKLLRESLNITLNIVVVNLIQFPSSCSKSKTQ